jgi:crotonobetainyl-CoA:carnitine CoA-transferase CaiB-like acyl-CoA transferase
MSVLEGVKVVELGIWVAGPGIAGVFADWGADVIKVESAAGDPLRRVFSVFAGADREDSPAFDLDNRGKKSVVLDLRSSEGRQAMERLLDSADVFVTNLRPDALQRLGLAHEEVLGRHPKVIYGSVSGYGLQEEVANLAAYDLGAFWGRSGLAASAQDRGASPPTTGGGFGDHVTALAGIGGILAALYRRTQTGVGQLVEISLLRTGVYCAGWDINSYLRHERAPGQSDRTSPANPLWNSYIAKDDRWFYLLGLEGDRHWPNLVAAIDRPELLQDERYRDARQRRRNSA